MIVVNFANGSYLKGQKRLSNSLNGHRQLMLSDYVSIGSPPHSESPYEFKVWAIETAKNHDPVVLLMDASMYVRGDLGKIEKIILEDGYFCEEAGHYTGRWTNQHTRNYFQVTEKEMHQGEGGMTLFSAGLLGLNFNFPKAQDFFDQWKQSAFAGCFRGSWADHRHDMTCASIIAQRLGFKYQRGGSHLSYIGPGYSEPEKGSVVYCQGLH